MKCDDGTWYFQHHCFGGSLEIMRKLNDFHHIPVRSSFRLSFYNVFIVCYLLIECFLKKHSPSLLPFLRFPLFVLFQAGGYFFIKTVQASLRVHVSKAIFSIYLSFFYLPLLLFFFPNSHNLKKKVIAHPWCLFYFLHYLENLYKDCKMFKTNMKYFLHFVMKNCKKRCKLRKLVLFVFRF